jgi:hypothetical protein
LVSLFFIEDTLIDQLKIQSEVLCASLEVAYSDCNFSLLTETIVPDDLPIDNLTGFEKVEETATVEDFLRWMKTQPQHVENRVVGLSEARFPSYTDFRAENIVNAIRGVPDRRGCIETQLVIVKNDDLTYVLIAYCSDWSTSKQVAYTGKRGSIHKPVFNIGLCAECLRPVYPYMQALKNNLYAIGITTEEIDNMIKYSRYKMKCF